jgi:probable O-glycosylation ligase (exosortase A-associated)
MRDYFIIAVVLSALPIGLFRPFYGLLVYAWISYMYPHMLAWSFAQSFPVAKLSALAVVAGMFFAPPGNFGALRQKENILMLLLWVVFTISTIFALNPGDAWKSWQDVSKLIVMSLLASLLLRDKVRMRYFLLAVAFSLGFYGFKGGLFGFATGGQYMVYGPGTSIIGSNNSIGLALNTCMPMLWYLAREESGLIKRALQVTFFLTIPAIMFTYSRASALTLVVILLVIALKSKHRFIVLPAVLMIGVLSLPYIPDKWLGRQQTMLTYEEDASAMSRIDNWKFCWDLALDHPFTGAGFNYLSPDLVAKYAPQFLITYGGTVWDTHSIYLGMLACHGFTGLFLFLSTIGLCLVSCHRMKRTVRNRPDLRWITTYCDMVQIGFLAFLINGAFVNMEYFDIIYHWIAVVASLKVICAREMSASQSERTPSLDYRPLIPVTS